VSGLKAPRVIRQQNIVTSPVGARTKIHCADSSIVRRHYQATTSEELLLPVVIRKMCRLVRALSLFVVTTYRNSINPIINPNLTPSH
jgi:hypothetical protein